MLPVILSTFFHKLSLQITFSTYLVIVEKATFYRIKIGLITYDVVFNPITATNIIAINKIRLQSFASL